MIGGGLVRTRHASSEEGHERLFVDLAASAYGVERTRGRLAELSEAEAGVVAGLPLLPRIH